jgi:hypothetical protein
VSISLETAFAVPDDVVFRELSGEGVILNLESGLYFGLDAVGTRAWQLMVEHGRLDRVFERLLEEYEVSGDVLRHDLIDLFVQLSHHGLVRQQA